jgi:hypothetical protein
MGDWKTVTIEGSIAPEDAAAARAFVDTGKNWDRFHCLCFYGPSLAGLGQWVPAAGGRVHAVGNLSERGYNVDAVAETLRELVAVAPSLDLKVHCGGPYEDKTCTATVTVKGGEVTVGPPEVESVGDGLDLLAGFRLGQILGGGES